MVLSYVFLFALYVVSVKSSLFELQFGREVQISAVRIDLETGEMSSEDVTAEVLTYRNQPAWQIVTSDQEGY